MQYRLMLYTYMGGSVEYTDGPVERAKARRIASKLIRRHREEYESPVSVLDKGRKWELETAEDAALVGDKEGILAIEPVCENCGKRLGGDDLGPYCGRCDEILSEAEPEPDGRDVCNGCGDLFYEWEMTDGYCDECVADDED